MDCDVDVFEIDEWFTVRDEVWPLHPVGCSASAASKSDWATAHPGGLHRLQVQLMAFPQREAQAEDERMSDKIVELADRLRALRRRNRSSSSNSSHRRRARRESSASSRSSG
jgi:hypothetical protein